MFSLARIIYKKTLIMVFSMFLEPKKIMKWVVHVEKYLETAQNIRKNQKEWKKKIFLSTRDYRIYRILPEFTGNYRRLPEITGDYRTLPRFTGLYRDLPDFTGDYRKNIFFFTKIFFALIWLIFHIFCVSALQLLIADNIFVKKAKKMA